MRIEPCPHCRDSRGELYRRIMAQHDALAALVLRLERYEWPDPALVRSAKALVTYPGE